MATSNVKGGDSKLTSNTNYGSEASSALQDVFVDPDIISSSTVENDYAQLVCNCVIKLLLSIVIVFFIICIIVIFGVLYLYYYDVI